MIFIADAYTLAYIVSDCVTNSVTIVLAYDITDSIADGDADFGSNALSNSKPHIAPNNGMLGYCFLILWHNYTDMCYICTPFHFFNSHCCQLNIIYSLPLSLRH